MQPAGGTRRGYLFFLMTVSAQFVPPCLRVLSTVYRQCPLRSSVPPCSPIPRALSTVSACSVLLRTSVCCPPSVVQFLRGASECCPLSTVSVRSVPPFLRSSVPPFLRALDTLRVLSTVSAQSVPPCLRVLSTVHRQCPLRSSVPQRCPSLASGRGHLLLPRCVRHVSLYLDTISLFLRNNRKGDLWVWWWAGKRYQWSVPSVLTLYVWGPWHPNRAQDVVMLLQEKNRPSAGVRPEQVAWQLWP